MLGIAAFAVTACTTDPLTGEKSIAKAGIGAGVGAIVGTGVGAYMDSQEKKLREDLANTDVEVLRDGNQIFLNMPSSITFKTDSDSIEPQFYAVLNDIGGVLTQYEKTYIDVAGHTDSTGPDTYNMDLSLRRAQSVGSYLTAQYILQERFLTRGYGESQPVADNATQQGRRANRRVEIILTPVTQS